jgi:hypothetical protein
MGGVKTTMVSLILQREMPVEPMAVLLEDQKDCCQHHQRWSIILHRVQYELTEAK